MSPGPLTARGSSPSLASPCLSYAASIDFFARRERTPGEAERCAATSSAETVGGVDLDGELAPPAPNRSPRKRHVEPGPEDRQPIPPRRPRRHLRHDASRRGAEPRLLH